MYQTFFQLKEPPFSLTPDTDFIYRHAGHQAVLCEVQAALQNGEGFLAVIAEVGSGKTLLCRELLSQLPAGWVTVYLPSPILTPLEIYEQIARELDLSVKNCPTLSSLQHIIFKRLAQIHADQGQVLVLIDEAQSMPQSSLEALRLLSNLETEKHKLLQIVFFAQPEFEERLAQTSLRQLRQRISFILRIAPLSAAEMEGYLRHRMTVAGYKGPPVFSPAAAHRLWQQSGGRPRLVNLLAHKTLLLAYAKGTCVVDDKAVRVAVADTPAALPLKNSFVQHVEFWVGLVFSLLLILTFFTLRRISS